MKQSFLIITLLCLISSARAQSKLLSARRYAPITAGNWLIGLESGNLLSLKRSKALPDGLYPRTIIPAVGYVIINNLVVGIRTPLGLASTSGVYYAGTGAASPGVYKTYRTLGQVGISPYTQLFFGRGSLKPYIGGSYSYLFQRLQFNIPDVSVYLHQRGNEAEVSAFTGVAYFVSSRIGLEARFSYGWQTGNRPLVTFPNRSESGYFSTYAYSGSSASVDVGVRYILGK